MSQIFCTMVLEIARKFAAVPAGMPGIRFRGLRGGQAPDEIPQEAKLLLMAGDYTDIRQKVQAYKAETGWNVEYRARGKSLEISVRSMPIGEGEPSLGGDALSILMELAAALPFAGDDIREFFRFYNEHIGPQACGTLLDAASAPAGASPPVLGAGMIEMTPEAGRISLSIRYCMPWTEELICDALMPVLNRYDMGLLKTAPLSPPQPESPAESN